MATTHATTSAAGAGLEGADEAFPSPIASLRAGLEGADEAFTSPMPRFRELDLRDELSHEDWAQPSLAKF